MDESQQAELDDTYRAIGRYVASFSQLIFFIRDGIVRRLAQPGVGYHLSQLALGEAPARQLADSFFGMCSEEARLESPVDRKIAKTLRDNVNDEITRRNDIAHGDWWLWPAEGSSVVPPPTLIRLKPARGLWLDLKKWEWRGFNEEVARTEKPPSHARSVHTYRVAELDELSESLVTLTRTTSEFGEMCLGVSTPGAKVNLAGRFVVNDGRVAIVETDLANEPADGD